MEDRTAIISRVCHLLSAEEMEEASDVLVKHYPFQFIENARRNFTIPEKLRIFVRDGFVDRYRGTRLVFPPVLYLISGFLPDQFPSHPNWKMSESHIAFWELSPTVDHVTPCARGGLHHQSNWVCCSMLTNRAKDNWTLEELGWTMHEPGDFARWDGLLNWFVREMAKDKVRRNAPKYCHDWLRVASAYATD